MIWRTCFVLSSAVIVLAGRSAEAQQAGVVGNLNGTEIAIQDYFGAAVFVGTFQGTVDGQFAFGTWWTIANHGPDPANGDLGSLPQGDGETTQMAGIWGMELYVLRGFRFQKVKFGGQLMGQLQNRGDNDLPVDNFNIDALLTGNAGTLNIGGVLYHDTFPPEVELTIAPAS